MLESIVLGSISSDLAENETKEGATSASEIASKRVGLGLREARATEQAGPKEK